MLEGLIFFMAPLAGLVAAGIIAAMRARRQVWKSAAALALVSTMVWLVYVGLYQHETPCGGSATRCPTVYGYHPLLPDEHPAGILLLAVGFLVPAAWVGWRNSMPPATAGAALALGPTVLAWWTAPRGDNDGLWALNFWMLPVLGGLAAVVVAVAERIAAARRRSPSPDRGGSVATPVDRLAALAIDAAIVGGVLFLPLTALSHSKLEIVAAIIGIAVATTYFAVALAWQGRTLGQSLVGLFVVDARTNRPVPVVRALLRSVVIVVEIALVPTLMFAIPAFIELVVLSASGRTLTDRLLETSVLSDRRSADEGSVPTGFGLPNASGHSQTSPS